MVESSDSVSTYTSLSPDEPPPSLSLSSFCWALVHAFWNCVIVMVPMRPPASPPTSPFHGLLFLRIRTFIILLPCLRCRCAARGSLEPRVVVRIRKLRLTEKIGRIVPHSGGSSNDHTSQLHHCQRNDGARFNSRVRCE